MRKCTLDFLSYFQVQFFVSSDGVTSLPRLQYFKGGKGHRPSDPGGHGVLRSRQLELGHGNCAWVKFNPGCTFDQDLVKGEIGEAAYTQGKRASKHDHQTKTCLANQ